MPAATPHVGEQHARRAREAMGFKETNPIPDIVELIESKAVVPVFLAPLPAGIAGLASRLDGRWYIVGDSASANAGRLRFTLAHELGHVLMGHEPAIDDDVTLGDRTSDPQEAAANYFAAELLVPRALIFAELGGDPDLEFVRGIADLTGTTAWVPLYRLKTLDLLSKHEFQALQAAIQGTQAPTETFMDIAARFAGTGETRVPAISLRSETQS